MASPVIPDEYTEISTSPTSISNCAVAVYSYYATSEHVHKQSGSGTLVSPHYVLTAYNVVAPGIAWLDENTYSSLDEHGNTLGRLGGEPPLKPLVMSRRFIHIVSPSAQRWGETAEDVVVCDPGNDLALVRVNWHREAHSTVPKYAAVSEVEPPFDAFIYLFAFRQTNERAFVSGDGLALDDTSIDMYFGPKLDEDECLLPGRAPVRPCLSFVSAKLMAEFPHFWATALEQKDRYSFEKMLEKERPDGTKNRCAKHFIYTLPGMSGSGISSSPDGREGIFGVHTAGMGFENRMTVVVDSPMWPKMKELIEADIPQSGMK